jgi:hypothetical protein
MNDRLWWMNTLMCWYVFRNKTKKKRDKEIASCIYMYVCLSVMIDLRNIQSMCGETRRHVYWYISRGTSYLDIDTHHTSEDKKNCNRDEHFFSDLSLPPCSFIELKEIKRGDIDLSSSTTRHRWFPPWEEMPCLIYINQLSLLFFPKDSTSKPNLELTTSSFVIPLFSFSHCNICIYTYICICVFKKRYCQQQTTNDPWSLIMIISTTDDRQLCLYM